MILNVWMSYSSSRKDDSTEDAQKQGGDQWNEPDSWGKTTSPAAAECEFAPRRTKRERHLKSANSSTSQREKKCRSLRHRFECYRGCLVTPNVRAKLPAEACVAWPRKENGHWPLKRASNACRSGSA